jgi:hypothetical protein
MNGALIIFSPNRRLMEKDFACELEVGAYEEE